MDTIKPVKIAVRTHNGSLADRLERMLCHWADAACVLTAHILDGENGDILFWDADTCPPPDSPCPALVVISDDESRAIGAYQRHPAAFLKSRLTAADFRSAMARCFPAWRDALNWLSLSNGRELFRLPMGGIQYVEASGRESAVYCENASFTVPAPMGKLAQQLPEPPFFRCQRSFIVHMSAVRDISEGTLITSGDRRLIPVSRKRMDEFRKALQHWNALEGNM
ncbi:MAG: LytTR family transcriptional regulator [Oscillospiraceae bacterium]|nr:LytTR family transcriptional regulator [Oscillospiraceae bacterium]